MAQQGVQLDQEQFCCSICLDLLKDPVTVPCGHSYCRSCIRRLWNEDDQRGRYSCPQCRQNFNPRPVLKKNFMLAEVVESMKKTGLQSAPPAHCYAGPGDVACDVCTGRRLKAVKSCLQCLVSYCDIHLQPHYQSPAFKKHKLVKASGELQENFCSRHNKVYDLFCSTDQQCICSLCCMQEHNGHIMTSVITSQQNIQQRIQDRQKDVKVLHQKVECINHSADRAVEDSDAIFTELISSMEKRRSEVREQIREQQKHEVSRMEELGRRVEQELTELRRRHAELEQHSLTEDHIRFLQHYTSSLCESTHLLCSHARPLRYFEDVTVAVSKMKGQLEEVIKEEWTKVSETVNRVDVSLSTPQKPKTSVDKQDDILTEEGATPPEPKTRAEFLRYSRPITLDPNTANQRLSLSKGNRKVTVMHKSQSLPDHPERFTGVWQVLSREALTGRCYWEIMLRVCHVRIAVASKDISRTGSDGECGFGSNDVSWALGCTKKGYSFIHKGIETPIPGPVSSRVGVYLDHSAGTLSFYSVSDTMTLLHTVHARFTQNLHAALWFYSSPGETAELCEHFLPTEDPMHFIEKIIALESAHPASPNVLKYDEDATMAVSKGTHVSKTVDRGDVSLPTAPKPKTRAEFLQYARPITLDPNTAHPHLVLSKGNRKVTSMGNHIQQSYPYHPERFTNVNQVLSREALTGRCYVEVEWRGGFTGGASVAVSHKDISRRGEQSVFGFSDKSWCLQCTTDGYTFRHRHIETPIPGRVTTRVGVYLDHSAGTLSFYSVSDPHTMTLLHTVHATFTHNLHVGLWPLLGLNTAELCDLK